MRQASQSSLAFGRSLRTFVSVVIGITAGGGLYLWQGNPHLAIAAFVIVAHAATVIVHCHRAALHDVHLRRELVDMQINAGFRRFLRLIADPYFWWSLFFGIATIDIACWFAGLHDPLKLGLIAVAWGIISVMLGYDVTLLYPTTRCRGCGYQLIGLLDETDPRQSLTCPECGRTWSKAQLCLVPPGYRKQAATASGGGNGKDEARPEPGKVAA
jgi:hypothetical protein